MAAVREQLGSEQYQKNGQACQQPIKRYNTKYTLHKEAPCCTSLLKMAIIHVKHDKARNNEEYIDARIAKMADASLALGPTATEYRKSKFEANNRMGK
jgi:hypothetical protein